MSEYNDDIVVTTEEVVRAVQKLDTVKSSGLDGIFAEHLLHCSERLLSMLAVCITGCFVHGFLPDSMLSTFLVPIIKDKTGRIDRMDNYRPIALASVMSKVVEIILLNIISKLLSTYSNQFGFQQKLGTDTCRPPYLHSERDCGKVSEFKRMYIYVFPRCFQSV